MKITIEKPACVILPTIGSPLYRAALESVLNQTYSAVSVLLINDGKDPYIFDDYRKHSRVKVCDLPMNVGANGFYGHRIYASFPHLIDSDYILFLDEDNWFDPEHLKTQINNIEENQLDFGYSLRNIISKDGALLCQDNCESLGKWPIWNTNAFHVDTSSYCFKKEMLINVCHMWHFGYGADRRFFGIVKDGFKHGNSGKYTLNYRLDGNKTSANPSFFVAGNTQMAEKYNNDFPWVKK